MSHDERSFITIVSEVPEGVETRNVAGVIFEETLANNFPQTKDIKSQNQEALWIWSRINTRKTKPNQTIEN